jgi:hypothetical protein
LQNGPYLDCHSCHPNVGTPKLHDPAPIALRASTATSPSRAPMIQPTSGPATINGPMPGSKKRKRDSLGYTLKHPPRFGKSISKRHRLGRCGWSRHGNTQHVASTMRTAWNGMVNCASRSSFALALPCLPIARVSRVPQRLTCWWHRSEWALCPRPEMRSARIFGN